MKKDWLMRANVAVIIGYLILIPLQISSCNKRAKMVKEWEQERLAKDASAIGTVGMLTPTATVATPCPTPDLHGKVWEQRTACFEYEEYKKKHGDYPPKVYDFINAHSPSWGGPCDSVVRDPELLEGCVTYWELIDPHAPLKKYVVTFNLKIPVTKYHWQEVSMTVTAKDRYLAKQVAFQEAKDKYEITDALEKSTKRSE